MNVIKKSALEVVLRSPSGHTDITLLAFALINHSNRVLNDCRNGDNRKTFWLNIINIRQRFAATGLHAFTGNDYVLFFLRKGKKNGIGKLPLKIHCF